MGSKGKRDANCTRDVNSTPLRPAKKVDLKATPVKFGDSSYAADEDDHAVSFVDKIWPLLEARMNSWLEDKLSNIISAAASDCINKIVLSPEFKTSLQESIGFDLSACTNRVGELDQTVKDLQNEIEELRAKTDDLEQYSRRNNIRVSGIEELPGESTDDLIKDILKKELDISILESDICRSHRIGNQRDKPRQIIVKFTNHNTKVKILKKRKDLKNKGSQIYINEDITKTRLGILQILKEQGKDLIHKTWTIDGVIFARLKRDNNKVISFSTFRECSKFLMNSISY